MAQPSLSTDHHGGRRSQPGDHPRWSLVTVTYNSAPALRRHWDGVKTPAGVEWVVVDNDSTDDSVAVARANGARVIPLGRNLGFGAGNNIGFRSTTSRYVCFVNPDVTPVTGELNHLEDAIDADPRRLVAPQLLNEDGTSQPNGRGDPYLSTKILHRLAPHRVKHAYHRVAHEAESVEARWLTGAVVAGRRDRLEQLGPWDERFFVYYEDSDLGLRNADTRGANLVVGRARWTHGWARETRTASWNAWRREVPSMVKFYSRYPRLLWRTP